MTKRSNDVENNQKREQTLELKQKKQEEEVKTLKKIQVKTDDQKLKGMVKQRLNEIINEKEKQKESSSKE